MAKRKNGRTQPDFNTLTEPLRRGRRRIRPEYVPELVAFLVLIGNRYQRAIDRFSVLDAKQNDSVVKGAVLYARHVVAAINNVVRGCTEGFDGFEWKAAVDFVDQQISDLFRDESPVNPTVDEQSRKLVEEV